VHSIIILRTLVIQGLMTSN